ncbi:transcription factor MYB98-like [Argentina anserina]|uniref:transcription factor MYB98-like n=1 Tax=Argentina anserina TaxID=57926 RepID=UPI0021764CAF|nr:transcription factor MYB98-like [Potentilla anserina]
MELNKLKDNPASQIPSLLVPENNNSYMMKPYTMKDEFLPFEASSSSSKGYLQDFHHLDNQFHQYASCSSSNTMMSLQNPCFEPFYNDNNAYTCDQGSPTDVSFYECKPLNISENSGHGQVLDNFQSGSGGGYLNYPNPRSNAIGNMMGITHRSGTNFLPLINSQDIIPVSFVVPDEVSCINSENGYYKRAGMNHKGTSRLSAIARAGSAIKGRKKNNVVKGQWTIDEDRVLVQLVEQYGVRKWCHIAQMLPGRIGKQCRERWHNHLRPDIKKDAWSEEEDKILIQAHGEIGNKWAEIAKRLPGRTENSIKNHWNATKRRQYSKRKCRSKYPRGSLLQEYIKSLNLDASPHTGRQRKSSNNNKISNSSSSPADQSNGTTASTKVQSQTNVGFNNSENDRLVPNYEFSEEEADFCFDDNLFEEGCSIDSLLNDISCATDFVDLGSAMMGTNEVKKELDLVEMISQVNEADDASS